MLALCIPHTCIPLLIKLIDFADCLQKMDFRFILAESLHFLLIFHSFAEKLYFGIVQNSLERVITPNR